MRRIKGGRKGRPPRLRGGSQRRQAGAPSGAPAEGGADLNLSEPLAAYAPAGGGVAGGSYPQPNGSDALIDLFHPHIARIVNAVMDMFHYPKRLFEDCLGAGMLALVEAAARYDPARQGRFPAFAFMRVRGAVIDHIRSNSEIPRAVYKRVRALEAATNLRLAREDSSQVCFADPRAEAVDMVSKAALAYRLLMSQGTDPCELASVSHNPEHIALTKALSKQLLVFVGQLPELERTIIEKIYFLDRRMADVAAEDVKRSLPRVWRCHQWALGVLRDQMLAWEEGKSVQPGEYEPGDQGDAGESGVKGSPKKRRRKRKGGVVKKGSRA